MSRGGKRAGAGRKKGSPNKLTGDLRAMVNGALHELGGQKWLVKVARRRPDPFIALLGKTLPKDVNLNANGSLSITIGLSNGTRRNPPG